MLKDISQINKIYINNSLHYKKLLLINKILLFKVKFKLNNNKISNQYKSRYKFYEKKSLNNYIKLKFLSPFIPKNKFINIAQQLNLLKYNLKSHIIFNYMYINKSTIQHYFIKFFKNTKFLDNNIKNVEYVNKKKTYFFNC